jgi:hypothetical protein
MGPQKKEGVVVIRLLAGGSDPQVKMKALQGKKKTGRAFLCVW